MQQLFQRLHQENLWDIFYRTEMRLLPLLARMELTGITIDVATVTDIGRILTEEASTLQAEAQALAGKEFNLASSKQVECGVSYMHCSLCFPSINGIFHLTKRRKSPSGSASWGFVCSILFLPGRFTVVS
jgi:hypothetical protein